MIHTGVNVTNIVLALCLLNFFRIMTAQNKTEKAIQCGAYDRYLVERGQWWRLLTVGFVHIQFWHFAMNMLALNNFYIVERVVGHVWFAIILFGSVLGGSFLQYKMSRARLAVGLSGGLYGLMVSYIILLLLYGTINVQGLLYTVGINLLINFMPNVGWQAHLGGAVTGLILTGVFILFFV